MLQYFQQFLIGIEGDSVLNINGDTELPGAIGTVEAVVNINAEYNQRIIETLSAFLEKELDIHPNR